MDRNLALEFVRVTEAAAISAAKWFGKGDKKAADGAAVKSMRERFNCVDFSGEVMIGEGDKDKAPLLFIGEKLGTGKGPEVDIIRILHQYYGHELPHGQVLEIE